MITVLVCIYNMLFNNILTLTHGTKLKEGEMATGSQVTTMLLKIFNVIKWIVEKKAARMGQSNPLVTNIVNILLAIIKIAQKLQTLTYHFYMLLCLQSRHIHIAAISKGPHCHGAYQLFITSNNTNMTN